MQRRNTFSIAHYANHPPAGKRPNVMIAAFDYREAAGEDLAQKALCAA